jgi:hypothetical protein
MILNTLFDRVKNTNNKLTIIVGVIASIQFIHSFIQPYWNNGALIRFKRLEKNLIVATKALDAEMEIDKWVLKNYHLELYHSNKDDRGQFKFSYLKYEGCIYESWYSRVKGCWVYQDGKEKKLRELSH